MERKIVCAANKFVEQDIVVLGARHWDERMRKTIKLLKLEHKGKVVIQGFIDKEGEFLDRKEALKVATEAKQIIKKTSPVELLFSEDLY